MKMDTFCAAAKSWGRGALTALIGLACSACMVPGWTPAAGRQFTSLGVTFSAPLGPGWLYQVQRSSGDELRVTFALRESKTEHPDMASTTFIRMAVVDISQAMLDRYADDRHRYLTMLANEFTGTPIGDHARFRLLSVETSWTPHEGRETVGVLSLIEERDNPIDPGALLLQEDSLRDFFVAAERRVLVSVSISHRDADSTFKKCAPDLEQMMLDQMVFTP